MIISEFSTSQHVCHIKNFLIIRARVEQGLKIYPLISTRKDQYKVLVKHVLNNKDIFKLRVRIHLVLRSSDIIF